MEKIEKILEKIKYFIKEKTFISKEISEAILSKVSSYLPIAHETISNNLSEEEIDFFKYVVESLLTQEIDKAIKSGDFSKFRNEYMKFNDSVIFHDEDIKIDVIVRISTNNIFFEKRSKDKENPGKMKKEYIFLFDPRVKCLDPSFSPICIVTDLKIRIGGTVEYVWQHRCEQKYYHFIITHNGKNTKKKVYLYWVKMSGKDYSPKINVKLPDIHILDDAKTLLFNIGNLVCSVELNILKSHFSSADEGVRSITLINENDYKFNENNYNNKPDLLNYGYLSEVGLQFHWDGITLYPSDFKWNYIEGIVRYFNAAIIYASGDKNLYKDVYPFHLSLWSEEMKNQRIEIKEIESDVLVRDVVLRLIDKGYIPKGKKYFYFSTLWESRDLAEIKRGYDPRERPFNEEDYRLTIYCIETHASQNRIKRLVVDEEFLKEFVRLLGFSF